MRWANEAPANPDGTAGTLDYPIRMCERCVPPWYRQDLLDIYSLFRLAWMARCRLFGPGKATFSVPFSLHHTAPLSLLSVLFFLLRSLRGNASFALFTFPQVTLLNSCFIGHFARAKGRTQWKGCMRCARMHTIYRFVARRQSLAQHDDILASRS